MGRAFETIFRGDLQFRRIFRAVENGRHPKSSKIVLAPPRRTERIGVSSKGHAKMPAASRGAFPAIRAGLGHRLVYGQLIAIVVAAFFP